MADVMGAFQEGRQFAQQEQLHKQAMEENKLRTMVLKHQIDGMKIEDRLRQRAIEAQNLQMMEGQPEASQPGTTSYTKNIPSTGSTAGGMTGLPNVVSGMIQARNAEAGGPADVSQTTPGPSTLPAPAAQATEPQYTPTRTRTPMKISGVPEMGIPDMSVQPRSAEDIIRASIAAKMAEPYTLSRGQVRGVGGQIFARGEPPAKTRLDLGEEVAAGGPGGAKAQATLNAAYPRTQPAGSTRVTTEDVLLDGKPAKLKKDAKGNYFDLEDNPIRNPTGRIAKAPNQGSPTAERRADQADEAAQRSEYSDFYRDWTRRYPTLSATERLQQLQAKQFNATPNLKPENKVQELPEPPSPPSLPKWKVMTPEERQAVLQDPTARITDAEMAKRTKAAAAGKAAKTASPDATAPGGEAAPSKKFTSADVAGFLKGKPTGKRYRMTDGSVWDLYPDGQFSEVTQK
jgi:hypothetical protein